MRLNDIRQLFLDFFEKRGHKVFPSSSLVPQDDPTLLFTNAGMVQFKKYFLGEMKPEHKNVVTVQRCIRAGGKHNDLENVGRTARHMTFFEMLGNFSFGGYFKERAITMAWEFVTEVLKIPKENILVTVYEEDDEAEDIWCRETDVRDVIRAGKESNFWMMGDEGPCGPCSEIIVRRDDADIPPGHVCSTPICDCDRYIEIWNLVFMQYNMRKDGTLEPLATKNIDTGMGLERIGMIMQGVASVFDTDVFRPLRDFLTGVVPGMDEFSLRVVMDSARASAFAIADGIMPSNESRGYVIRRIIRRALRYSMRYVEKPFLNELARLVAISMSDFWNHLSQHAEIIQRTLKIEEERFFQTISRVLPVFERKVAEFKRSDGIKEFPADIVFSFWDTHGLPIDLMKEILAENSLYVDDRKIQELVDSVRARSGRKEFQEGQTYAFEISYGITGTEFVGYHNLVSEARVIEVLSPDGKPAEPDSRDLLIVTDRTSFYPEGGGQVGDTGMIKGEDFEGIVTDTRKLGDFIAHIVRVKSGRLRKGARVILEVDQERRWQTARHHTTTHLLHAALRTVLGTHVRQMGSLVEPRRLRFDFSHPVQLSESEINDIEDLVNRWLMANYDVSHEYMKLEDAMRIGALAFFGEKYGKIVRVVRIGEVSVELCGGTHLRKTGEAGSFKITKESGVSAGVRRVEAVAGWELLKYLREKEAYLEELARVTKSSTAEILAKVRTAMEHNTKLKSEIENLRRELLMRSSNPRVVESGGVKLVFDYLYGFSRRELGYLVDRLREKFENAVIVVLSENSGEIELVVGTNSDQADSGEIARRIARFLDGSGGGKKDFAEGKGKVAKGVQEILEQARHILEEIRSS